MVKSCKCWVCQSVELSLVDDRQFDGTYPEYYDSCSICGGRNTPKVLNDQLPEEVRWLVGTAEICTYCAHGAFYHVATYFCGCWAESGADLLKLGLLSFLRRQITILARGGWDYWWHFQIPFGDVDERDDQLIDADSCSHMIRIKPRIRQEWITPNVTLNRVRHID